LKFSVTSKATLCSAEKAQGKGCAWEGDKTGVITAMFRTIHISIPCEIITPVTHGFCSLPLPPTPRGMVLHNCK